MRRDRGGPVSRPPWAEIAEEPETQGWAPPAGPVPSARPRSPTIFWPVRGASACPRPSGAWQSCPRVARLEAGPQLRAPGFLWVEDLLGRPTCHG